VLASFKDVLDASRELLGPRHPNTLTSMNNLAEILRAQGDLAGARQLHQEVLDARRELLGPRHPNTSISAWNLYMTLRQLALPAARTVFDDLLAWLADATLEDLGADQAKIRQMVLNQLNSGP
jgi:hypothetical protein